MRVQILIAGLLIVAGPAAAQPIGENPPTRTIQCIDVGGRIIPPNCRVPASRLDPREDICTCIAGGDRVEVAVCAKGETPPPEGKALNIARHKALKESHSLLGATFEGRRICVEPRPPLGRG